MKTNKKELLDSFKGGLIVSCQVQHDDPTFSVDFVVKMAKAAQWGGAAGVGLQIKWQKTEKHIKKFWSFFMKGQRQRRI